MMFFFLFLFSVIRIFDLVPGATRQNEPITVQSKTIIGQVDISRAGSQDDQYLAFIDTNRDIFCTSSISSANIDIFKIGISIRVILLPRL